VSGVARASGEDYLTLMSQRFSHAALACLLALMACHKSEEARPEGSSVATAAPVANALREVGTPAPDVVAVAHTGESIRLKDFKGRPVVVYFYPKDDTPGCTTEAQEIRDLWSDLEKTKAVVLGVSTDDEPSHRAFAEKYELPFLLLADTDQRITRAFGVPVARGRAKRVTFVIDAQGRVAKVFPEVDPRGHGKEILAAVESLQG
jgi:peroxiredoxin Q/BCP